MKQKDTMPGIPDLPMVMPEEVGMSSERFSRIRSTMQRYIDLKLVPGVVTLVARKGRVVHLDAIGYRDVEAKAPMKTDTIFRIASMTKPITSVALMMLYEEGHFLLSDPISKWIPEFSDPKVSIPTKEGECTGRSWKLVTAARPITVRHLLTHTSGLSSSPRGMTRKELVKISKRQNPDETVGDFIKRYATVPLNFHPGEGWTYSRATCVVGHLVEIISGLTLDEFFREKIFKPLNMRDSYFYLPLEKLDRFAACYSSGEDERIKLSDPATAESRFVKEPHLYFMGSGGLISTVVDYFRFYQMMLNGGELDGVRILSRKTVELMTRNHTGDFYIHSPEWPWAGFGLGFAIIMNTDHINTLKSNHPGPVSWSEGTYFWGGAYCTLAWVDPIEELIGVVMTQVGRYKHNLRNKFIGLAYQAIID